MSTSEYGKLDHRYQKLLRDYTNLINKADSVLSDRENLGHRIILRQAIKKHRIDEQRGQDESLGNHALTAVPTPSYGA